MANKTQIATLTMAQTAELYNQLVDEDKQVRKFANKNAGHQALSVALRRAGKIVTKGDDDTFALADAEASKPRTELTDDRVITVLVDENPKRPGSATHARFANYKTGGTIGEYLDAAVKTDGDKARARHRYLVDIRWDVDHKFIEVK